MIKLNLSKIGNVISRATGRTGLKIKKFSPEILIVTGVLGIATSTILACRATLKVEKVLDESSEKLAKIHYANENVNKSKYSVTDYRKDLTIAYGQTGFELYKLYAPSVTVSILSITSILCSYKILHKRNIALMAAYKGIEEAFVGYRKRVVAELGADKDRDFRYGMHSEKVTITETGEDGVEKKVKTTVKVLDKDGNATSLYARFFDECSSQWSKTPEYNLMTLKCQQSYANDLLNTRGHVFLNEVYEMLGLEHSQAGAVVGWVKGNGDSFIDFGIYDTDSEACRAFVNGLERSILLDFNVDGVMYDKI